jgi:hypothetical protein
MDKANKFDDRESLPTPVDHLLAIVMNSNETTGIVETLNHNGFSPKYMGVLTEMEDASKLDAASGKKGFFAKLATFGIDMGDQDLFRTITEFTVLVLWRGRRRGAGPWGHAITSDRPLTYSRTP